MFPLSYETLIGSTKQIVELVEFKKKVIKPKKRDTI